MTDEELIARLREIQGQAGLFASAAADRIEALVKDNRELVLQGLADSGQAQEAYEAQLKAEAPIATLTAQVERLTGAAKRMIAVWETPFTGASRRDAREQQDKAVDAAVSNIRAALTAATEEGHE